MGIIWSCRDAALVRIARTASLTTPTTSGPLPHCDNALRHASFPRDETSIRHLHGCLQPSFDVEKHPRAIRVLADCTLQQRGIDAIEEALDIQVQNPRITPASLPRDAQRIERRLAGPVAIRVRVEARLH